MGIDRGGVCGSARAGRVLPAALPRPSSSSVNMEGGREGGGEGGRDGSLSSHTHVQFYLISPFLKIL